MCTVPANQVHCSPFRHDVKFTVTYVNTRHDPWGIRQWLLVMTCTSLQCSVQFVSINLMAVTSALMWELMWCQTVSYPIGASAVDVPGRPTICTQLLNLHKNVDPARNAWLKAKKAAWASIHWLLYMTSIPTMRKIWRIFFLLTENFLSKTSLLLKCFSEALCCARCMSAEPKQPPLQTTI